MVGSGYAMVVLGVLVSYFLIFPLTFRFLGTYQVSDEVDNLITLDSYISMLVMMCFTMGIVFEIPMLSWLFAKLGVLSASFHAPLSETRSRGYPRNRYGYYDDIRRVHAFSGCIADVGII